MMHLRAVSVIVWQNGIMSWPSNVRYWLYDLCSVCTCFSLNGYAVCLMHAHVFRTGARGFHIDSCA